MNSGLKTLIELLLRNQTAVFSILLGLIVLSFYWPLTSYGFLNFDDPMYVTDNSMVAKGLSWASIQWAFTTFTMGHWHPLTWISHLLDVSLFGMNPWGHHLMSVLIFSANAAMVFLLLKRLKFFDHWAYLGALFFALHPMRLESVAWISERKDVLSFFFGISALVIYLELNRLSQMSRRTWLYIAIILFSFSLLAKPTFVSLPVLLLLYEIYVLNETNVKFIFLRIIPFALLAALSSSLVVFSQAHVGALKAATFTDRLLSMSNSYQIYLEKFFWPKEIAIFYPKQSLDWRIVGSGVLVMLLISVALFLSRRSRPLAWLGWIWFLVAALPLSGIIPIGGQAYADRWTLLPHVGLVILSLTFLSQVKWPLLTKSLTGVAVAGMAFFTFSLMPHWKNSESIFRETLRVAPENFMAHTNLGTALAAQGRTEEAEKHYEEAVRLNPTYPEALNNLGSSRAKKARYDEAIGLFIRALKRDPNLKTARQNLELACKLARNKNCP